MADTANPQSGKTLEMRVAELEDKLAQTQITEDDIRTFQRVSAAMAARAAAPVAGAAVTGGQPCIANQAAAPALSPQPCIINPITHCIISHCIIHHCIINHCIINPIINNPIITNPIIRQDCTCGPCLQTTVAATPTVQNEFEDLGK